MQIMDKSDFQFLQAALDSFIAAAITGTANAGPGASLFRINADSFLSSTARTRLKQETMLGIINFFRENGVECDYVPDQRTFAITMRLESCRLSPQQATNYAAASEYYAATTGG